jgi:LAO/AO transport system kinase
MTAALSGDRRSVSMLMSLVEDGGPEARQVLSQLYPHTGRAYRVGVTGSPGAGKSTLVSEMAKIYRQHGERVGIVTVDPTSPFSGGALLGDRIRMRELSTDPGVFIRSMATRGSLGGLARATADVVSVLDAAGFDPVLIETVGAGQSEVDIARTADTTIVIEMPSAGDEVQAIKAGILEIADILVVNKADLPGADNAVAALRAMLDLGVSQNIRHHGQGMETASVPGAAPAAGEWRTPLLKTCALRGEGIAEVVAAVAEHRRHLLDSGQRQRQLRSQVEEQIRRILRQELLARLLERLPASELEGAVDRVTERREDPYSAAAGLIALVS